MGDKSDAITTLNTLRSEIKKTLDLVNKVAKADHEKILEHLEYHGDLFVRTDKGALTSKTLTPFLFQMKSNIKPLIDVMVAINRMEDEGNTKPKEGFDAEAFIKKHLKKNSK